MQPTLLLPEWLDALNASLARLGSPRVLDFDHHIVYVEEDWKTGKEPEAVAQAIVDGTHNGLFLFDKYAKGPLLATDEPRFTGTITHHTASAQPSLVDDALQVCYAIEKLPASEEQTAASVLATALWQRLLRTPANA